MNWLFYIDLLVIGFLDMFEQVCRKMVGSLLPLQRLLTI